MAPAEDRITMKQTVGILAYGTLIADPGWEIDEVRTRTIEGIMTPFLVEFARSSDGRGGAPTLVPYEGGRQVCAQVIVVDTPAAEAADRLYRREVGAVGSARQYKHRDNPGRNTVIVDRLEGQFWLNLVLYTRRKCGTIALKAFKSQLGIDIRGRVPLITGEKKHRQGKENNCGEDSHARCSHQL